MNHSLEGSCQCGEVHYQIKGEPLVLYRCHCTECQKQSGSGFGMSMWVRNDDFEILRGSLKHFQRTADSGGKMESYSCGNCGVRIFNKTLKKKQDYMVLKPVTLHNKHFNPLLIFGSRVNRHGSYLQMIPNISKDHRISRNSLKPDKL